MLCSWLSIGSFCMFFSCFVCTKPCNRLNNTCCYNEYFDDASKECRVCMDGYIGWNCNQSCKTGFYGYLCTSECNCLAHLCDKQTGCRIRQNVKSSQRALDTTPNKLLTNMLTNTTGKEEVMNETTVRRPSILSKKNQQWMQVTFLLIGSFTTFLISGTLICVRKRCIRRLFDLCPGGSILVHQGCMTNRSSDVDRSSGYDDIRFSQLICDSSDCVESGPTLSRDRITSNSVESRHLLSVIYDIYNDEEEDYSRLLLRKHRGACIASREIYLEDEKYVFLRGDCMNELKTDSVIRTHRSLPTIPIIQNPICLGTKCFTRSLSESTIPL